jgi:acetyltransferase
VIGASKRAGSIGSVLMKNMRESGYRGRLYGVNPKYRSVIGVKCFDNIEALPEKVELAVIATPARTVPEVIESCGRSGVRAAVVITAGFGETGANGAALEQALVANARRFGVRIIGPNCLGLMRPGLGFNATFARGGAAAGSLALVSQSGAICTAMLDWARPRGIGFSSVVSLGGTCDVDFGEILDYLACDAHTEHILAYIEGIHDARRFVSSLRAVSRIKPVVLMKVGRHPLGSRAARSHTGALVGGDDVFNAALRRTGAVRVQSIGELVAAAQALALNLRPQGDRLVVITNGGGPGVIAADRAADLKLPLAELSVPTLDALRRALPATWSHGNPVDLIGDAGPDRYTAAVTACLSDSGVDGVLAILTPQAMTDATAVARAVVATARGSTKPLLACWMGGKQVAAGRTLLADANIPVFATPEPAVQMFAHVAAYYRNQRRLLEAPPPKTAGAAPDVAVARDVIAAALAEGRT